MRGFRDRVRELRRVKAGELKRNPQNWRRHPSKQRKVLEAMLERVGFAGAVVARETKDGQLELVDGHLRADVAEDQELPVLVVDLDEQEADAVLATYDPVGAMAEADGAALRALMEGIEAQDLEVGEMLDALLAECEPKGGEIEEARLVSAFEVVAECADEKEQETLFERLREEGFQCRLLTY